MRFEEPFSGAHESKFILIAYFRASSVPLFVILEIDVENQGVGEI